MEKLGIKISPRHLSVRVPWHDSAWNGKICCSPYENGSCMFLPRINETKDVNFEEENAGKWLHEIEFSKLPPCVGEKVSFMSPHKIHKKVRHPYSMNEKNNVFYAHYKETNYCYPEYSFSIIPYNWMLKNREDNSSEKAKLLNLPYKPEKEPNLSFENTWIQESENQKILLDTFINPIKPNHSLVFIYAKNVPFIESTDRVLIGVGHISSIGQLTEYEYDSEKPITFRSYMWERPIHHTIRDGFDNGFLLPYQEFFKFVEHNDFINIEEYIAFAPSFEEFSFGSEWVSNDSAIESLLILNDKLKKFEAILPNKNYSKQIAWIDNEISRLWKMRGPFPGLGAVLSGMKVKEGNFIAWELDKIIRNKEENVVENPWDYIEKIFQGNTSFLSGNLKINISDTLIATWENYSEEEKDFLQFLSRMNLNNDQVELFINKRRNEQIALLKNPYLLYEKSRLDTVQIPVALIDKAVFADNLLLEIFPLAQIMGIFSSLDKRRIRAYCVQILEQAALEGHTLLTDNQMVTKLNELPLLPLCNPSLRNINSINDFLEEEIKMHILDEEEQSYFKLNRFDEIKHKIKIFVQKRIRRSINPAIEKDWLSLIENKFGLIDETKPLWYQERDKEARIEKAHALNILSNSRISVLIGPAGTGKTTLLNLFCEQPFIRSGTILKLAPTGKARVKMGKDAQTIAQFLIMAKRYDPETGQYYINPNAEIQKYDTVIVDEASMLTEEQLAALIDSISAERFILIGDYRQLPPIGAGRPFVDILEFLKAEKKGVAELKVLFRQLSQSKITEQEQERLDVRLGKWFSDDEIKKQEVDIFKEIAENPTGEFENIKFIEWHNVKHLEDILIEVMNAEIENLLRGIEGKVLRNPQANFDASLGSNYYLDKSNWSGFGIESANEIENWQILSPMRTAGYGTKVINQQIQKIFRGRTKEKAIFPGSFRKRKMNRPVGDDGFVYGDKIINTRNIRWNKPWNNIFNPNNVDNILKYMANGEIGIHIGKYGEWQFNSPRPLNITFSSQPDYAYSFRESDFQEDGDIQMELAYSITVHKSQGSGFKVVLFILPNPCPILSRELLYTALTRQEDRIVILHQGNFKDYQKFTTGEYSETGRRLTDLFSKPKLKEINKKFYDTKYIQVSTKGEFMISKSEVIIADQLHYNGVQYVYEAAISDDTGITIHPDFTIEDSDAGITYYWEHLGMLTKDDYRSKWQRKKEWYKKNGIVEYTENSDAEKQLIITRDKPDGGIDSSEIKTIIEELFK